jgi:uncharacterized protein YijF (DUF1287 family)
MRESKSGTLEGGLRPRRIAPIALTAALALGGTGQAAPPIDRGIFSDLDGTVALTLPRRDDLREPRLGMVPGRKVLVVLDGDYPLAAFGLPRQAPAAPRTFGAVAALLDPGELRALSAWFSAESRIELLARAPDADGDGIPDQLDVLYGARKLAVNRAAYTEGYVRISYPGGDVPRGTGVCSDTIVRALRNAGYDLQRLVAEDIRRAPNAYLQVRRPDANIDHRRVKNLLHWFQRHALAVPHGEPLRPGEILFLDTFPGRPGPEHVGIASDRRAPSGQRLVINNWTNGHVEQDMELLSFVPVTHRFRLP